MSSTIEILYDHTINRIISAITSVIMDAA